MNKRSKEFYDFITTAGKTAPEAIKMFPIPKELMIGTEEETHDFIWAYFQTESGWEIWEYYPAGIIKEESGWTGPNTILPSESACCKFIHGWMEDFAPDVASKYFPRTIH